MLPTTRFKRLFVRNLLIQIEDDGKILCDLLKELVQAQVKATANGKFLSSTSANGHSTTWQIPPDFSPMDAASMVEEIITRSEEAKAALIAAGNDTPTDQQIIAELLDKLQIVRNVANDYRHSRYEFDLDIYP